MYVRDDLVYCASQYLKLSCGLLKPPVFPAGNEKSWFIADLVLGTSLTRDSRNVLGRVKGTSQWYTVRMCYIHDIEMYMYSKAQLL